MNRSELNFSDATFYTCYMFHSHFSLQFSSLVGSFIFHVRVHCLPCVFQIEREKKHENFQSPVLRGKISDEIFSQIST